MTYTPPDAAEPPSLNVLGGAASFAAVGARLFYSMKDGKKVGFVIHEGADFPARFRDEVEAWGISSKFIATPDRNNNQGQEPVFPKQ